MQAIDEHQSLDGSGSQSLGLPASVSKVDDSAVDAAAESFSATAFLSDVKQEIKAEQQEIKAEHVKEAHHLQKELKKKRHADYVKSHENEQTLTTVEEIWEKLCAKHGPSPYTLEVLFFLDLFHSCQEVGLTAALASTVNGNPNALTHWELESRDVAYLCYLVLEGVDPDKCGEELVFLRSDEAFTEMKPKELLRGHADACLRLPDFRRLIHVIADVMQLQEDYIVSAFVWIEVQRFEMPEQLYELFFMKNNQNRFLGSHYAEFVQGSDHEHVNFGRLDRNDFFRLCHALELVDSSSQSGKAYEFWVLFWEALLKRIHDQVHRYAERRPGQRISKPPEHNHGNHGKAVRFLEGRTELTVLLELMFMNMPTKRFKSPLDICYAFLSDDTYDPNEALAPLREACAEPVGAVPVEESSAKPLGQQAMSQLSMKRLFQERDRNHNGRLEYDELAGLLKTGNPAMPESRIRSLFQLADHSCDGTVDFNEFVDFISADKSPLSSSLGRDHGRPSSATRLTRPHSGLSRLRARDTKRQGTAGSMSSSLPRPNSTPGLSRALANGAFTSKDDIKREFHARDTDGNGILDYQELTDLLMAGNPAITNSEIFALFRQADANRSGTIDFDEFVDFISSDHSATSLRNRPAWH